MAALVALCRLSCMILRFLSILIEDLIGVFVFSQDFCKGFLGLFVIHKVFARSFRIIRFFTKFLQYLTI